MADIAASDVTVTIQKTGPIAGSYERRNKVKITFGDGALLYPANGVPMPAIEKFGMKRDLEDLILTDQDDANGIHWKWDKENKKLRAYIPGVTVSAAGSATLDDFPTNTTADPLATAMSVSLNNNAGAGTKYLGQQKELGNVAIAAQTLYAEAVGW
jgi:hypothetical protein